MLRVGALLILIAGGCTHHHHATMHRLDAEAVVIGVNAASLILDAVLADHAAYEPEPDADEIAAMTAATAALAAAPPALDRAMITSTLDRALPTLARCARPTTGRVTVSVAVMPSGTVDRVILRDPVDAATSECVTDTLHAAVFPMTRRGGSFSYPFTL